MPTDAFAAGGAAGGGFTPRGASAMYRLYNRYSGEHLFTTNKAEYDNLVSIGWNGEGCTWNTEESLTSYFVVTDPDAFGFLVNLGGDTEFHKMNDEELRPVYRLYNPYSGDHHYTMDKSEYDQLATIGWRQEGAAYYAWPYLDASTPSKYAINQEPVYRLFNPWLAVGSHFYTADKAERDSLVSLGWRDEGVGFAVRFYL